MYLVDYQIKVVMVSRLSIIVQYKCQCVIYTKRFRWFLRNANVEGKCNNRDPCIYLQTTQTERNQSPVSGDAFLNYSVAGFWYLLLIAIPMGRYW